MYIYIYIHKSVCIYIYINNHIIYIYTCSQFFCQHISVVGVYVYIYIYLSPIFNIYIYIDMHIRNAPKIGVQMVLQQSFSKKSHF